MFSWSRLFVVSVFLSLLLTVSIPRVCALSEDDGALVISEAEEIFVSAYAAVLEAEQAGANVSGLLDVLNLGGDYLSEAYVWYRLGVSENVSHFVGLCRDIIDDVHDEAFVLRDEAEKLGAADFVVKMFGSALGVVVILIGGFVAWRVFKLRYSRRILRLRSEVFFYEA